MLAAQIAFVHVAAMKAADHLAFAKSAPLYDSAERAFNKLSRTFVSLVEALNRYRGSAVSNVTLQQNILVTEGDHPVVGSITHAPRDTVPEKTLPSAFGTNASNVIASTPIIEGNGARAPVTTRCKLKK
jgi:hypothetical protein